MGILKNFILKVLGYPQIVYSQEGEELIVDRLLEGKKTGFYVDIGAHHPKRFSNTYSFYKRGWHGINIDAAPGSMKLFDRMRKRDINLEIGIAETEGEMTFYIFDEGALNTFDKDRMLELEKTTKYKHSSEKKIKTYPLKKILERYVKNNEKIDFMDIDAEGLDIAILKSNDWDNFRPTILLVEGTEPDQFFLDTKSEIMDYLSSLNYKLYSRLYNTMIFIDMNK